MKKTKNNIVLIVLLMLLTTYTFASNTSGEEELATFANPGDPGVDPGATPINDYLFPMLVLGVGLGYRLLRKKTAIVK
jgi:hypothetical protein